MLYRETLEFSNDQNHGNGCKKVSVKKGIEILFLLIVKYDYCVEQNVGRSCQNFCQIFVKGLIYWLRSTKQINRNECH